MPPGREADHAASDRWTTCALRASRPERCPTARASAALFDYIKGFYNSHRRHSALDYLSPATYEEEVAQDRRNYLAVIARRNRGNSNHERRSGGPGALQGCLCRDDARRT